MTDTVATIFAVHPVAVAVPGPDFAVVTRAAMSRGRRAGIVTAAGIATGLIAHVVFALLGLGAFFHAFPAAARGVALVGALWLAWLGAGCLRAKPEAKNATAPVSSSRGDYVSGILTNLLNPKVVVYFAGLFSQVDASRWTAGRMVAIGGGIVIVTFLWFAFVASVFSTAKILKTTERRRVVFDRALGVLLLAFASALAARAW